MGSNMAAVVMALVAVAMGMMVGLSPPGAMAQGSGPPACAQKLIPCGAYLGSSKPPESCCGPMKEAVKNELPCLCSLFNNTALLDAFKINVTQALQLPKHCGITSDQSVCKNNTAATGAVSPPGSSASPATPGGKNGATSGVTWMGASAMTSLLVLWWSVVA